MRTTPRMTADELVQIALDLRKAAHKAQLVMQDLDGPLANRIPAAQALDDMAADIEKRAGARYVEEARARLRAER